MTPQDIALQRDTAAPHTWRQRATHRRLSGASGAGDQKERLAEERLLVPTHRADGDRARRVNDLLDDMFAAARANIEYRETLLSCLRVEALMR